MFLHKLLSAQTPMCYKGIVIHKLWELNYSNAEKLYPSPVCGMFSTCKKYGLMYKQMDLFIKLVTEPRLCVWWLLSLTDVRLAKFFRYIFRLVCHENILEANAGRF